MAPRTRSRLLVRFPRRPAATMEERLAALSAVADWQYAYIEFLEYGQHARNSLTVLKMLTQRLHGIIRRHRSALNTLHHTLPGPQGEYRGSLGAQYSDLLERIATAQQERRVTKSAAKK